MSGVEMGDAIGGLVALGLIFIFFIMVFSYVSASIADNNRLAEERKRESKKKAPKPIPNDDGWLNVNFDDVTLPAYGSEPSQKNILVADTIDID